MKLKDIRFIVFIIRYLMEQRKMPNKLKKIIQNKIIK